MKKQIEALTQMINEMASEFGPNTTDLQHIRYDLTNALLGYHYRDGESEETTRERILAEATRRAQEVK